MLNLLAYTLMKKTENNKGSLENLLHSVFTYLTYSTLNIKNTLLIHPIAEGGN